MVEEIPDDKNPQARFVCDCRESYIKRRSEVISGRWVCKCTKPTKIPGSVVRRAPGGGRKPTHGKSRTPVWRVWSAMRWRCENPASSDYKNYGGRGIRVEWLSFDEFYADMGDPPAGFQLERRDNNGNYSKSNCEWATPAVQSVNKRNSKRWVIHGVEYKSAAQAGKALGVSAGAIQNRTNGHLRVSGERVAPWPGYSSRALYEAKTAMPSAIDIAKSNE